MSSHYSSSYAPVSPPWSHGGSPAPAPTYDAQPRAPVMPYRALPAVDAMTPSYAPYTPPLSHHGLITPPPSSDGGINPVLSSSSSTTLVRYDLAMDPMSLRMSSAATHPFPAQSPASISGHWTINIECEGSGMVIPIRSSSSSHGVTCADIFRQLYDFFHRPLSREEWARIPDTLRGPMRVSRGSRSQRLRLVEEDVTRMVDYLQGRTVFKRFTVKRGTQSNTPTWVLQTSR